MTPIVRPRVNNIARRVFVITVATVLVGACRADSLSAPQATDCTGQPGCRPTPTAPVDATVYSSLSDGMGRLAPSLGAGAALGNALNSLDQALRTGHDADARTYLAEVYAQLIPLRVTLADGTKTDLPDASALRLELVPVANALGVQAR